MTTQKGSWWRKLSFWVKRSCNFVSLFCFEKSYSRVWNRHRAGNNTLLIAEILSDKNVRAWVSMDFTQDKFSAPIAIEKIKILGAPWELLAKQHCQSSPFTSKLGLIGQNRQCCLAGSSQGAPRILIFSIAMVADYTFYVKSIESHARTFLPLNNFSCK